MTLIAIGHNDTDIVIGADSLTTVTIDGARQSDISSEKIFLPNKNSALALSGNFSAATSQFIIKFCQKYKGKKDIESLQKKLLFSVAKTLTLDIREDFQLTLVGYENKKPQIRVVAIKAREYPKAQIIHRNYHAMGYDNPCSRAYVLMEAGGVRAKPETKDLEAIIEDSIRICIDEFKDSEAERLGGKPFIKVLRRYAFFNRGASLTRR